MKITTKGAAWFAGITGILFWVVLFALLPAGFVFGATLNKQVILQLGELPDSIKLFKYYVDGAVIDSADSARTEAQRYDTVITVETDTITYLMFKIWWTGEDSSQAYIHETWNERTLAKLEDSLAFQGSAAGLTAAEIADTFDIRGDGSVAGAVNVVASGIGFGGIVAGSFANDAITAAGIQADAASEIGKAAWDQDTAGSRTDGTFGKGARNWINIGSSDVLAISGSGAAAAALENILTGTPGETMTANITGNLSGSVGSLTVAGTDLVHEYDTSLISSGIGQMLKDTSAYQGSATSTDTARMKIMATNNPSLFYGPSTTGTGDDTVTFYALDTSGTDQALQDVDLTVFNTAGEEIVANETDGAGSRTFSLDPATYTLVGSRVGYYFPTASIVVSGNSDSVAFMGYNIAIGSPASADLCRVFGYLKDNSDQPIIGVTITATRTQRGIAIDTVGGTAALITNETVTAESDTSGYWFLDLRKTTNFLDTLKGYYNIKGHYGGEILNVDNLYVPDAATLNLGDTLALR